MTSSATAPAVEPHEGHEHELRADVLGFFDSIVMAVAGSAPAYSIAATTARAPSSGAASRCSASPSPSAT